MGRDKDCFTCATLCVGGAPDYFLSVFDALRSVKREKLQTSWCLLCAKSHLSAHACSHTLSLLQTRGVP